MAVSDLDEYLFAEGKHSRAFEKLGAHPEMVDGVAGTRFAVWAPNAAAVSVIAECNGWTPGRTQLGSLGDSGIWEGFVAGVGAGDTYKYAIRPRDGSRWIEKADPYALRAEMRPSTASIVATLDAHVWGDAKWTTDRGARDWMAELVSIYEVHLGSWRQDTSRPHHFLSYRELGEQLANYVVSMGFTHVELMPVSEHPLDLSWGYQTTGYFAPTARFGPPEDFMYFVDRLHQAGIGVILDWVPAHFPKDAHGLARFDGTPLYEHADPRQGEHPDWGTLIFNYGRHEVRSFLISNAMFWFDRYHIDGLRVDAVASMLYLDYSRENGQWLPNEYGGRENLAAIEFFKQLNTTVHQEFPGVLMVAEESTAWPGVTKPVEWGGLGFDLKWNMGWMHDTLEYMALDPVHRRFHQNELTFSLVYAFSERFVLPLSHDEVTHGKRSLLDKMPGDIWQKFANLRLLYGFMTGHPGKKLLFMGAEFGQWNEWDFEHSLDWHLVEPSGLGTDEVEPHPHRGLQRLVADLNALELRYPALHQVDFDSSGFEWIDHSDSDNSVIVFVRHGLDFRDDLVFACNFTPVIRYGYRIGLPHGGEFIEVLNTDHTSYGGSGVVNPPVMAEAVPSHGRDVSVEITLPPLAVVIFRRNEAKTG